MDIDDEIKARIRAAKVWDKQAKLEDFQIKAAENGYVLINLKTRRAQLIYDEFSELHDWEQLFPDGVSDMPGVPSQSSEQREEPLDTAEQCAGPDKSG